MVNDNAIVKDIDALDLYEFAIDGLSMDYAKTIGVLRARLAKALPKDKNLGARCLEACMWHSDWENAQEIAVSLNKTFPGDRKLLFQNILTTFLVATSDTTHGMKKNLFPNLVKAQVDRAFNLRAPSGKEQTPPGQIPISEDEIKLWIQIREKFGLAQENLKLLSLPIWGPLYFLEHGFTDAFLLSLRLLTLNHHWEAIIHVANAVFDRVIATGQEKSSTTETNKSPTSAQQADSTASSASSVASEDVIREQYINMSREWFLWTSTVTAIKHLPNGQEALKVFRKKLTSVVRILINRNRMNPIFQQNYNRIKLDILFTRAAISTESSKSKPRDNDKIQHLIQLSQEHIKDSNCFTMLKGYLELLNKEEIANFIEVLKTKHAEETQGSNLFTVLLLISLRLRVRFFQATSLTAGEECRSCCSGPNDGPDCVSCLKSITKDALEAFRLGIQDKDVSQKVSSVTGDPLSNLAVLGSICLVKLAGLGRKVRPHMIGSPLYHTNIHLFLQAVIWLDFYLKETPRNDSLRLLLVKLYLMMGCVTRALEIWNLFDVKNTLLECLGTVCLDRLASISPSHFMTGPTHLSSFGEPFIRHFKTALEKRYPDTVVKTLQNNSYAELPSVIELAQNQSRNCVVILAVVENRRGIRLKSGRNETAIEDEPLIGSLSPNYELQDFTDYNPLPNWAGPQSTPIQELAACGPLPTNRRCHLSILAERFLDLVSFAQPKDFKPSQITQLLQVDWQTTTSSCQTLYMHLDALTYGEGFDENDLTGPEAWYFRTVTELAKLVKLIYETVLPASSTKAARETILAVIRRILAIINYQIQDFLAIPNGAPAKLHTLHGVAALHAMGMLRESTLAIKSTVQHVTAALDRLRVLDKSRATAEAAWLAPETKKLLSAAATADARMKDRVKRLTEDLHASGWIDRLVGWAFDDAELAHGADGAFAGDLARELAVFVPEEAREGWAVGVADSWRDVVKGWGAVRFE
ncbi:N-acetyltransferase B complex non catalytic subunit-domain-containing protein [Hypoxylon argillaceum]|nr:N-acetyltransferase B complex non catalytic subunit-domain-containing protein [Hypoxylon argillaceum]